MGEKVKEGYKLSPEQLIEIEAMPWGKNAFGDKLKLYWLPDNSLIAVFPDNPNPMYIEKKKE